MSISVTENPSYDRFEEREFRKTRVLRNERKTIRLCVKTLVRWKLPSFFLVFFIVSTVRSSQMHLKSDEERRCRLRSSRYYLLPRVLLFCDYTPTIKRSFTNMVLVKVLRSLLYFYCSC